jgi:hypothetical protein
MSMLLLSVESAPAGAPPDPRQGPKPLPADAGGNAALKYWQAFATLPPLTALLHAKVLKVCQSMPLDGPARGMATEAGYALAMMRRGAALPRCDWAIGWADEGLGNRLPHLDLAKLLSALACLRARLRFEEGQGAEAVSDIFAAMAMARHTSRDGSLPAILTGYAIERQMSETLAHYLPKLDAKTLKDLKKRLDALPAGGSLGDGVREEQILETRWFVRQITEAKDTAKVLAFLNQVWPEEGRGVLKTMSSRSTAGRGSPAIALADTTDHFPALPPTKVNSLGFTAPSPLTGSAPVAVFQPPKAVMPPAAIASVRKVLRL